MATKATTKKVTRKSTRKAAVPKKAAPAKAPLRGERAATPRRLEESALRKKYPRVIAGSLEFNETGQYAGKQIVQIKCEQRGCKVLRIVATSDLFQVTRCVEHTLENRRANRSARRQAAAS